MCTAITRVEAIGGAEAWFEAQRFFTNVAASSRRRHEAIQLALLVIF